MTTQEKSNRIEEYYDKGLLTPKERLRLHTELMYESLAGFKEATNKFKQQAIKMNLL